MIMLTIVIVIFVVAGLWFNVHGLALQLRGFRNRQLIWVILIALIAVAAVVGFYGLVDCSYTLSPRLRVQGLPIPLVSFVLEGDEWTAFPIHRPMAYFAIAANMLVPVLFVLCVMRMALRLAQRMNSTRQP